MKKIIVPALLAVSSLFFIECNNSATGESQSDSANRQTDTVQTKIVTEGGLRDSIATGASDSTHQKDSIKK